MMMIKMMMMINVMMTIVIVIRIMMVIMTTTTTTTTAATATTIVTLISTRLDFFYNYASILYSPHYIAIRLLYTSPCCNLGRQESLVTQLSHGMRRDSSAVSFNS